MRDTMRDSVTFKNNLYMQNYDQIMLVNAVYDGVDTAREFLVQQGRETADGYKKRKENATLRNFVRRSIEGFVGMIFRKQVQTTGFSDTMNEIFNRIDKKRSLNLFARELTTALVRDGKAYIICDTDEYGSTLPYATLVKRTAVINWFKDENGNYEMVVVKTQIEKRTGVFKSVLVDQYRVYHDDGTVEVYELDRYAGEVKLVESIQTEFTFVPIIELDVSDIPPLYDIAKLTIKHMNRTSLKDKYLDMSATPIPLIWGAGAGTTDPNSASPAEPAYVIGVDEAFVFDGNKDENDFQWRELDGSSIEQLQKDLNVIENEIVTGVLRATENSTTIAKTATQAYYEAAEASNRVTMMANIVEIGLNDMAQMLANIANETIEPTAKVIVNKDYNAMISNNDDLRLLWEVYLGGALSIETFLSSLERYETIDIGSVEKELLRIKADKFTPETKTVH